MKPGTLPPRWALALAAAALFAFLPAGCTGRSTGDGPAGAAKTRTPQNAPASSSAPRVTFIELGSDRCIPCVQMRSVMQEIQQQYGDQVRIVFYDVWKPEGEPYARLYRIRVIPTQVFLDSQGREYFRHEGYFPTAEVVNVLALQGVKKR